MYSMTVHQCYLALVSESVSVVLAYSLYLPPPPLHVPPLSLPPSLLPSLPSSLPTAVLPSEETDVSIIAGVLGALACLLIIVFVALLVVAIV